MWFVVGDFTFTIPPARFFRNTPPCSNTLSSLVDHALFYMRWRVPRHVRPEEALCDVAETEEWPPRATHGGCAATSRSHTPELG